MTWSRRNKTSGFDHTDLSQPDTASSPCCVCRCINCWRSSGQRTRRAHAREMDLILIVAEVQASKVTKSWVSVPFNLNPNSYATTTRLFLTLILRAVLLALYTMGRHSTIDSSFSNLCPCPRIDLIDIVYFGLCICLNIFHGNTTYL